MMKVRIRERKNHEEKSFNNFSSNSYGSIYFDGMFRSAIVPNPVKLKPYRTFLEVDQPVSEFIFRMKQDKYDGVLCALFEADGGAWKMEATERIKKYLESELKEYSDFTVIS